MVKFLVVDDQEAVMRLVELADIDWFVLRVMTL